MNKYTSLVIEKTKDLKKCDKDLKDQKIQIKDQKNMIKDQKNGIRKALIFRYIMG